MLSAPGREVTGGNQAVSPCSRPIGFVVEGTLGSLLFVTFRSCFSFYFFKTVFSYKPLKTPLGSYFAFRASYAFLS
jgi:hypothetical protein